MPSRPHRFRAKIQTQGPNLYVEVPAAVTRAFARYAESGRVRVSGKLEGAEIRGTLVPRGGGHWLFVHAGMRAAAGVTRGQEVELTLSAWPWEEVPIPKDARAALRRAGALADFEALGSSERHELLRWVDVATSARNRRRRLEKVVEQVRRKTTGLKRGSSAKRRKPLWTCPQCGHRFVNKNQYHSCKRYSLEHPFAKSSAAVHELFARLREMVESVGPVHLQAYGDHVAFLVRVRFLAATPKKKWLDVGFWLPRRIESPRFRKIETLTPTDHVHLLRVTGLDELDDEVSGWIREGYAVGEQRHPA